MSLTRSALFAFTIAAAAVGCRNTRNDDLAPPEPMTKPVEATTTELPATTTQTDTTAQSAPEPGAGGTAPDQNDTSDTSGVTGGGTLNSDTANQNANTVPGDAGVDRTARGTTTGSGSAVNPNPPMGQTPPADQLNDDTGSGSSSSSDPSLDDTATGTGTTNSGTDTENAGTGGGAGAQPQR